ncbi:glycosyltransferase 87 family protein [Geminocystis herdmanii]|uniref:glycosyltransferase 87 family protein n=1 Tax=Geminocystis herdmanii TaxID=669359 RepID=UPI00130E2C08|nr:glycosyltransferase 87 family protein [Geminocystis herdmanii]
MNILSLFLLLLSIAYLVKGFSFLVPYNQGAVDLYSRWQEQQYIYHGYYPYFARKGSDFVIEEIGAIESGGYLPWSFFSGFLFFPPISYPLTRVYHIFLNLISLSILGLFAYNLGKNYHQSYGLFGVASVLAISANCTTLGVGQYGLIINAFLIIFYILLQKNQNSWAGLFLAIAMLKPNISAFYFFIPVTQKRWKTIVVFSAYIIIATFSIVKITNTNLWLIITDIFRQSSFFSSRGNSFVNLFLPWGISANNATIILAIVGTIICLTVFYLYRHYSLLTLFAIASIMGRVCFYHLIYDNVMMVFLLLALLELTFKNPHKLNIIVLLIVGITLWIPAKLVNLSPIYEYKIQFIIWILAGVYLLIAQTKNSSKFNVKLRSS